MVNADIDIFEMSYEESVSYLRRIINLEKISHTNGPTNLPIGNEKYMTIIIGTFHKSLSTCGVTILTRTTTKRLIAKKLLSSNSRKCMTCFEAKAVPVKKSLIFRSLSLLKQSIHSKGS
jgi:hypothetical protein